MTRQGKYNLVFMLVILTALLIFTQLSFYFSQSLVSASMDALTHASIIHSIFNQYIIFPLLAYLTVQVAAYGLIVCWSWLVAMTMRELCFLSQRTTYYLGVIYWLLLQSYIFTLNAYLYKASFFAGMFANWPQVNYLCMLATSYILLVSILLVAINVLIFSRHRKLTFMFAIIASLFLFAKPSATQHPQLSGSVTQPNIILIGLDSLRPDHVAAMPVVSEFMRSASVMTDAYTPLARTFPSWVSILTAKYPLHHQARANLVDSHRVAANDNLAKRLQRLGYITLYGTDEARFTDITESYGFDRVIGARGGAVEFLLGGLADFPLSNVLLNTSLAKYLLPYHFANRAMEVTYQPSQFLSLVQSGLAHRDNKPVFLAIHLCLSHWPYRYAQDGLSDDMSMSLRYRITLDALDKQFSSLLSILRRDGLLQNSIVIVLSDHGVTFGEYHDRVIERKNYHGDANSLHQVTRLKLGAAPLFTTDFKNDYALDASFGQGTDVLSLKQYHVVFAMRGYGVPLPSEKINSLTSLMDIAPTLLDYLQQPPLQQVDGISLLPYFARTANKTPRTFYFESGDKIAALETNDIQTDQVVRQLIGAYEVSEADGLLRLRSQAEKDIIGNKQRAVMEGDWLLARYPAAMHYQLGDDPRHPGRQALVPKFSKPYFVLVNVRSGWWTVVADRPSFDGAPLREMMQKFDAFYGEDVMQ